MNRAGEDQIVVWVAGYGFGAHGHNEMHRYTRSEGKQSGTPLHRGTLGDGMRAAIAEIKSSYPEMIEGWQGQ